LKVRPKLFLLIFAIAFASLMLLSAVSYWQSSRAIEASLRDDLRRDADWLALRINFGLSERETSVVMLARTSALRDYLRCHPPNLWVTRTAASPPNASRVSKVATSTAGERAPLRQLLENFQKRLAGCGGNRQDNSVPDELGGTFTAFLLENRKYYGPVSVLNINSVPLFRGTITQTASTKPNETASVTFQTQDLPYNTAGGPDSIGGDSSFISARDGTPLRALIDRGPLGPILRYTVPVLPGNEDASRGLYPVLGALVVDLRLDQLFEEHASDVVGTLNGAPTGMQTSRVVVVLHHAGRIYYHSNETLKYQPITSAMPHFKPVTEAMVSERAGAMFYESSNHRSLAAYRPLGQFDLSLAVASDYAAALQPARRSLLLNIFVSVLIALIAALGLTLIAQRRSGSLARLTQGVVAIARGELDQKLVVSSAENQSLADGMNAVTTRLREQLAREAESRQFDSFMRLSAMLTHDLKNAISGLSLLVRNMERQFDNAEFRADAMSSLKEATEKLQRLVTKLGEPVNTMSGEHQRPRPTNLVSIIQRVLASVAKASPQSHDIEIHLPEELVALVDADRIEKVIENLVINSLEAMGSRKGALTIAGGASGRGEVFFSISDTGPGITRDFQERRLFRPFATTKQAGVGLGLYTCREVVRAHGGSIEVDSEPGVGTTFRVVLPSGKAGDQ